MLIGRESKLEALEKLYKLEKFQLVVLYGARKTGKTALSAAFAKGKPTIFFAAQKLNRHMNLAELSRAAFRFAGEPEEAPFGSWQDAFRYIGRLAEKRQLLLVIDDFEDIAGEERALLTAMQRAIDNDWKNTRLFVLLSGGRIAFMENEVMGKQSPLLGRRSSQIKLDGLDYIDAAKLMPACGSEDKLRYYCALGGIPEYLDALDKNAGFEENIRALFFRPEGLLFREPARLFAEELREPAIYNSILAALAGGALRLNEIVAATGEDSPKVNKYLQTLLKMQVISRDIPFGEASESSRKGIYTIVDNGLCFWFRFVLPNRAAIERGEGESLFPDGKLVEKIDEYIGGKPFEEVCAQYLQRRNRLGELPFLASASGRWWRSSKEAARAELVAANLRTRQILFGEYAWDRGLPEASALQKQLAKKEKLFPEYWERFNYIFAREPFTREIKNLESTKLKLVDAEGLFK